MSSHDIRYNQDKWPSKRKASSRVALMYLPLLTSVTMDSSFLNSLYLDFEKSNDTTKNKFFNNENDNEFDSHESHKSKRSMMLNIFHLIILINDFRYRNQF